MTKDQRKRAIQSLNNQLTLGLTTLNYWNHAMPRYWGDEEFHSQAIKEVELDIEAIIALARIAGFKVVEKSLTMMGVSGNVVEVDKDNLFK